MIRQIRDVDYRRGFANWCLQSINGGQRFQNITGGLPNVPTNAKFL
ncbi:MAG: hypothetical protein IPG90_03970 [Bacteroidetes bacterium]|nr:hypothetical protein [Bacteroidota bacterium]